MSLTPVKDDSIEEKVAQQYRRLRADATREPGITENWTFKEKPSWFQEDKFQRAQNWAYQHFVSVFLGHLAGLLVAFNMPSMMPPIAKTRSHYTVSKLFNRYLETFIHVKIWYESNPFKEGTEAYKSLRKVNSLHKNIVKVMNEGFTENGSPEAVWVSQYDMVLILWSIMAPIVLFPRNCGIHRISRSEMEDLIHFWAVLGYTLGIKDEYNIMLRSYDEAYWICDKILEKDVRPVSQKLEYPSNHGFETSKYLAISIQPLAPIVSLTGLMRRWYRTFGITANIPIPREQKFGYKSVVTLVDTLLRYAFFRWAFGTLLRFMLILRTWQRVKISARFDQLYPNPVHPDVDPKEFKVSDLLKY